MTTLPEYGGTIRHLDCDPGRYAASVTLQEIAAQREGHWPDFHPEHYCHRCGQLNVTWYTTAETWDPVMRGGDHSGWGPWQEIVCIPCFIEVAEHQSGPSFWRITRDQHGIEVLTRIASIA